MIKKLVNTPIFSWIAIITGGLGSIFFLFFILTVIYCTFHPGQNWGLMVIVPLIWGTSPFPLLLAGGIYLLRKASKGNNRNNQK